MLQEPAQKKILESLHARFAQKDCAEKEDDQTGHGEGRRIGAEAREHAAQKQIEIPPGLVRSKTNKTKRDRSRSCLRHSVAMIPT